MTIKSLLKKLYKECDHSAEIVVRIKDEDIDSTLNIPIQLTDIKTEESNGKQIVIIDLTWFGGVMDRRSFLKLAGSFLFAATAVSKIIASPTTQAVCKRADKWLNGCRCGGKLPFCNKCKSAILSQALNTTEGRSALAVSMVEPIRRSLEYQAIGRKLLLIDELPPGALAHYRSDLVDTLSKIRKNG
jgi:hypothetical protein